MNTKKAMIVNARVLLIAAILASIAACGFTVYLRKQQMVKTDILQNIKTIDDVVTLFPGTMAQLQERVAHSMQRAKEDLQAIIEIPHDKRTFANTAQALDYAVSFSDFSVVRHVCDVVTYLYPDKNMRDAAHELMVQMQNFCVDQITGNKALFEAFKAYAEGNAAMESLSAAQHYFLSETMNDFVQAGLNLPIEQLERVKAVKKEIAELALSFENNIAQDIRTLAVSEDEVVGINTDFLASLKRDEQGSYLLGTDYPTRSAVYEQCANADTRRRYCTLCRTIAYPVNHDVLQRMLQKRDELAHLLGFDSYAHLDTVDQMVKNPERVYAFLHDFMERVSLKEKEEIKEWLADLPASVTLTDDGRIKAWDMTYLQTYYKKKYLAIDEQEIACYFPMQKTVQGLLDIYSRFLSIDFKEVPVTGLWDPEVTLIEAYDKDKQLMGYLLLDLYPRDNKFTHACQMTVIPAVMQEGKRVAPAIAVVVANFPKPTATKPSLLQRDDVSTFFHEFGHALHAFCGATDIASFSGTSVKRDFVEMPSQMFELWLEDKEVLHMLSSHYETGEPLPDALIDRIIRMGTYDSGNWIKRQLFFSLISLDYHGTGKNKDFEAQWQSLCAEIFPYMMPLAEDRGYASFGHLADYTAKYYGYLWSRVFAHDMFETIKAQGLFNTEIGQRYIAQVIGKGGSEDPNDLIRAFLGREPRSDAFLKNMGLVR